MGTSKSERQNPAHPDTSSCYMAHKQNHFFLTFQHGQNQPRKQLYAELRWQGRTMPSIFYGVPYSCYLYFSSKKMGCFFLISLYLRNALTWKHRWKVLMLQSPLYNRSRIINHYLI